MNTPDKEFTLRRASYPCSLDPTTSFRGILLQRRRLARSRSTTWSGDMGQEEPTNPDCKTTK